MTNSRKGSSRSASTKTNPRSQDPMALPGTSRRVERRHMVGFKGDRWLEVFRRRRSRILDCFRQETAAALNIQPEDVTDIVCTAGAFIIDFSVPSSETDATERLDSMLEHCFYESVWDIYFRDVAHQDPRLAVTGPSESVVEQASSSHGSQPHERSASRHSRTAGGAPSSSRDQPVERLHVKRKSAETNGSSHASLKMYVKNRPSSSTRSDDDRPTSGGPTARGASPDADAPGSSHTSSKKPAVLLDRSPSSLGVFPEHPSKKPSEPTKKGQKKDEHTSQECLSTSTSTSLPSHPKDFKGKKKKTKKDKKETTPPDSPSASRSTSLKSPFLKKDIKEKKETRQASPSTSNSTSLSLPTHPKASKGKKDKKGGGRSPSPSLSDKRQSSSVLPGKTSSSTSLTPLGRKGEEKGQQESERRSPSPGDKSKTSSKQPLIDKTGSRRSSTSGSKELHSMHPSNSTSLLSQIQGSKERDSPSPGTHRVSPSHGSKPPASRGGISSSSGTNEKGRLDDEGREVTRHWIGFEGERWEGIVRRGRRSIERCFLKDLQSCKEIAQISNPSIYSCVYDSEKEGLVIECDWSHNTKLSSEEVDARLSSRFTFESIWDLYFDEPKRSASNSRGKTTATLHTHCHSVGFKGPGWREVVRDDWSDICDAFVTDVLATLGKNAQSVFVAGYDILDGLVLNADVTYASSISPSELDELLVDCGYGRVWSVYSTHARQLRSKGRHIKEASKSHGTSSGSTSLPAIEGNSKKTSKKHR